MYKLIQLSGLQISQKNTITWLSVGMLTTEWVRTCFKCTQSQSCDKSEAAPARLAVTASKLPGLLNLHSIGISVFAHAFQLRTYAIIPMTYVYWIILSVSAWSVSWILNEGIWLYSLQIVNYLSLGLIIIIIIFINIFYTAWTTRPTEQYLSFNLLKLIINITKHK